MARTKREEAPPAPSPQEILAEARDQLSETERLAADLEAAVRDGDESIGFQELADAQKRVDWARLRVDAAEKKAAARTDALWRQQYTDLLERDLEAADVDIDAAEIEAELALARPHIEAAIIMLRARNNAIGRIAKYGSDEANYRDPEDGLVVTMYHKDAPGLSMFTFRGKVYAWSPAERLVKQLLRPLRDVLHRQQGGGGGAWLEEATK